MNLIRTEPEAFYTDDALSLVGEAELNALKAVVHTTPRKRIRICTHRDTMADLHEMFVCYTDETEVYPHKHVGKDETFYVIEGEMDLMLYDDTGTIASITKLAERGLGRPFCVRIPMDIYHSVRLRTPYCILHLSTNGPFEREKTIWAKWDAK